MKSNGNNSSPLFSIIVPVYNVEKYVGKCLDSILNQTYESWELLLIDDGSSDGSSHICDQYEQRESRIKVFHTKNNGLAAARNVGLRNAVGEWVAFIDSDDYVDTNWLAIVKKRIDWQVADIIIWGNYFETEKGVEWQYRFVPEKRVYKSAVDFINSKNYRHACWVYMYNRGWIMKYKCQFPDVAKITEDQCFLAQYLCHNPRISSIDRAFYHYVNRNGSICNSPMTVDIVKDKLDVAVYFARYAAEYDNIDKQFVYDITTRLFYDYFSYTKQIDRLYNGYAQSVYRQSYKEIIKFFPTFSREKFLKRASYSIRYSYRLKKLQFQKSRLLRQFKLRFNQTTHPFRVIEGMIKEENRLLYNNQSVATQKQDPSYSVIADRLKHSALYSQESGITNVALCDHEVIVSLTTYKERIHEVYLTIESIMQGTLKPNRIILWLAEDEFGQNDLPLVLQRQVKRGLEVRYCEDLLSYKKIIPSLALFPDACLVTIDDDVIYELDLLEHLLASYKAHPNCVSSCRTHRLKIDKKGMPLPYLQWDMLSHTEEPSCWNFLTGVGGNLFPPKSFPEQVFDKSIYLELCPYGDDIWLNAMLLSNSVKVAKAFTHSITGEDYINNESPSVEPLWMSNHENDGNDPQLQAIWEHFELYRLFS